MTSRGKKEKARRKRKGNKRGKRHLQDVSNFHWCFSHLIFLPNVEVTGSRPTVESKDVWHLVPDPQASPTTGEMPQNNGYLRWTCALLWESLQAWLMLIDEQESEHHVHIEQGSHIKMYETGPSLWKLPHPSIKK